MFIIVNHDASTQVQIILLLKLAYANVTDPIRYNGNTQAMLGCGDVKVSRHEPTMVNATDMISK